MDDEQIEAAAFSLYAAGPWGEFEGFRDGGVRAATDAHRMETYRRMVRLALESIERGERLAVDFPHNR